MTGTKFSFHYIPIQSLKGCVFRMELILSFKYGIEGKNQ